MPRHRLLLRILRCPAGIRARTTVAMRVLRRIGWWLAGMATAAVLAWVDPLALRQLDVLAYDVVIPTRQASRQAPVVVAIDEASLAALGRWPWPRGIYTALIRRLGEADSAAIGVAFPLPEPDLPEPPAEAALLAAGLRQTLYGRVGVEVGVDGKARSLFLGSAAGHPGLPTLAQAVHEAVAVPVAAPRGEAAIFAGLQFDAWLKPDEVLLPRTVGIAVIPFVQALRSPEALAAQVSRRAVFVGVTATGLGTELSTPLAAPQTLLPAVLFHAQAFDVLQNQAGVRRANDALVFALALLAVSVLALWPPEQGHRIMLAGLLLCLPIALSAWLVAAAHVWLSPALATVSLAVAMACWLARQRRRIRQKLRRARRHAQATLQAIDDAVFTVGARDQCIRFVNATGLHQADGQALVGRPLRSAYPLSTDSMARVTEAIAGCLARRERVHVPELLMLHGAAGPRTLRAKASPMYGPAGQLDSVALVFTDVTDLIAANRKLDRAAHHDALTGLPNRSLLHERLVLALSRVQRRGGEAAILFLDIDHFKHINDSLGHRAGDQVLKLLAERLRSLCRDTDTVARWGGDEFVLVLEDIGGVEGAAAAAAKVVEVLSQDIVLGPGFGDVRLPSAASVGAVLAPRDGMNMEDLLSKADMAMYRAKTRPGASYEFWSQEIGVGGRDRRVLERDGADAA